MGFFDDIFGGFFDFNGDGKTTWDEEWIAYKILEDINKENSDADSDSHGFFHTGGHSHVSNSDIFDDAEDDYSWRTWCEDGSEYGIFPDDYKTEEEYIEALNNAKVTWRDDYPYEDNGVFAEDYETEDEYAEAVQEAAEQEQNQTASIPITVSFTVECPALDKLDEIKESDYPNKRQYDAAYKLANELIIYFDKKQKAITKEKCHFILEKASTVLAAHYLTVDDGFLFAQAVKDHFPLPIEIEDEDEEPKLYFTELIKQLAKKDIPLSIRVWDWCVEQFLPYSKYAWYSDHALTCDLLNELYDFPKPFELALVCYFCEHPDFAHRVITEAPELTGNIDELVCLALSHRLIDTAKMILIDALEVIKDKSKCVFQLVNSIIQMCENGDELESMEAFQNDLFPAARIYLQNKDDKYITDCQSRMTKYILETERYCPKYAYSRCNAWRNRVPNGKKYRINVLDYDTEQEYLEALDEARYGWREYYDIEDCNGIDPSQYETEREFKSALKAATSKAEKKTITQENKQEKESGEAEITEDNNVYTYCGVVFSRGGQAYSYRTEDSSISVGDSVVVPVGRDKTEKNAKVVFVGQYTRYTAPYPVDKTRFIIRKSDTPLSSS